VNEDLEIKANDKVGDLLIHYDSEENDASTSIEQELQADIGESDNVELDQVHGVNNADSHANTDSNEQINFGNQAKDVQAESMFADSSEMKDIPMPFEQEFLVQHAFDSVEVNTADKATDANGHPSKDSDDRIDVENMDVDEPDMIYDGFKTNDANADQTESTVNDDVEMNDVFMTIEQGLQVEAVCDSVEMDKADKTSDA
jgi:hypothetical protein